MLVYVILKDLSSRLSTMTAFRAVDLTEEHRRQSCVDDLFRKI